MGLGQCQFRTAGSTCHTPSPPGSGRPVCRLRRPHPVGRPRRPRRPHPAGRPWRLRRIRYSADWADYPDHQRQAFCKLVAHPPAVSAAMAASVFGGARQKVANLALAGWIAADAVRIAQLADHDGVWTVDAAVILALVVAAIFVLIRPAPARQDGSPVTVIVAL